MRTFTAAYARVKDSKYSLEAAIDWFLTDRESELREATWKTYRSHLYSFLNWLPEKHRTLASLTTDTVEDFIRPMKAKQNHTAMNKVIALKALSNFLAEKKAWYTGSDDSRLSILAGAHTPKPSKHGLPGYSDADIRTLLRVAGDAPNPALKRAWLAVELHGFRSKETRMLLLKNIVFGKRGEMGHFVIEDDEATKTTAGVRIVPMEQIAKAPLMEYIRNARPEWTGEGDETLFLTDEGRPFSDSGWHTMAQRFKQLVAKEGLAFKQHRLRVDRAQQLHEAGVPETAILQIMGWEGPNMLRRYVGKIPTTQLKTYPTTLAKVFNGAI